MAKSTKIKLRWIFHSLPIIGLSTGTLFLGFILGFLWNKNKHIKTLIALKETNLTLDYNSLSLSIIKNSFLMGGVIVTSILFLLLLTWITRKKVQTAKPEQSLTDPLTGLYNRQYFFAKFSEEFERVLRYKTSFSFVLIGIDNFKTLNKEYGHHTGDKLLQDFAKFLKINSRNTDICCRYGGTDMALLLIELHRGRLISFAEKLRETISDYAFEGLKGEEISLTASIGVYSVDFEKTKEIQHRNEIIVFTEDALTQAKSDGGNRTKSA